MKEGKFDFEYLGEKLQASYSFVNDEEVNILLPNGKEIKFYQNEGKWEEVISKIQEPAYVDAAFNAFLDQVVSQ